MEQAARRKSEAEARAAVLAGSEDDAATCEKKLQILQRNVTILEGKISKVETELKILVDAKEAVEAENAARQAAYVKSKNDAFRRVQRHSCRWPCGEQDGRINIQEKNSKSHNGPGYFSIIRNGK